MSSTPIDSFASPSLRNRKFLAFTKTVDRVLSVSKEELVRLEAEYRKQVDANPNRRGPKRKIKPSASHDPA
jgi:hypothetical protein